VCVLLPFHGEIKMYKKTNDNSLSTVLEECDYPPVKVVQA